MYLIPWLPHLGYKCTYVSTLSEGAKESHVSEIRDGIFSNFKTIIRSTQHNLLEGVLPQVSCYDPKVARI